MRTNPIRARGGALKKIIITLAVVVVVVLAAVVFLLPMVASNLLTRDVPVELASGKATLKLRDVRVSWGGPQRVGKVTLDDAQGRQMADLSVQADASILGIALGGNVGKVSLSGVLDVKEEQVAAAPGATPPKKPDAAPPSAAKPAKRLIIPRGLKAQLEAKPLKITYTPRPGSGLQPITIDGLEALASVLGTGTATVSIKAASPSIDVNGNASGFVNTRGELDLAASQVDLAAAISAPGELIEALARVALAKGAASGAHATTSAPSPPSTLELNVQARGGRLKLVDPAKPITLSGPVPQAVVEMFAGEGASIDVDVVPTLKLAIGTLDVPLPNASGALDLRGATFRALLTTTPMAGSASLEAGAAAKPFRVEPVEFELATPDVAQVVTLKGGTRASFDGQEAGMLALDAEVQGILDDKGMPRSGLPARVRGELRLAGVPTRLADPFLKGTNLNIVEVLGPALDATLTVRTLDAQPGTTASAGALPPTEIDADVRAQYFNLKASALADSTRVSTRGDGIVLEASRLGAALPAFLKDSGFSVSGPGTLRAAVPTLDVPLLSGMLPDLNRAVVSLKTEFSDLSVESTMWDRPLVAQSLKTSVSLAPDKAPRLDLDHGLSSRGAPISIKGGFDLAGLITKRDGAWPFLDVTPQKLRPAGSLDIAGLPSDGLGAVPAELRDAVVRVIGPDLALRVNGTTNDSGVTDLVVALDSSGAEAAGSFALDGKTIRSTGEGFTATLRDPGPLMQELMKRQPDSPVASVDWRDPLLFSLQGLALALPEGGQPFDMSSVEATTRVQSRGIGLSIRTPDGRSERVSIDTLDVGASATKAGGLTIDLDNQGSYSGEAFTFSGDLALGSLLGPKGLDLSALKPKGKIEALGVPTALAAAFDPKNGGLAREAVGPKLDLAIVAPAANAEGADGAATGERSASLTVKGANLNAASSVALNDRTINVGRSTVSMTLTPGLVRSAVEQNAPDLSPRPELAKPATLDLTLFETAVNLNADNAPDMATLRPVRAMLTSRDDLVLRNLPGGAPDKPMNAGLRGVEAGLTYNKPSMMQSEASLRAQLFEPSEPGAIVAKIEALTSLINIIDGKGLPPTFGAKITEVDTARVDTILGRPGFLSELLGNSAGVALDGSIPPGGGVQNIDLTVAAPRLDTTLALQKRPDRVVLTRPSTINIEVPAAWANRYALPPGEGGKPPQIALTDALKASISLQALSISLAPPSAAEGAPAIGPMKPGIFAVNAALRAPSIKLRTADGQQLDIQELSATVNDEASQRAVAFDVNTRAVVVAGAGASQPLRAVGKLADLADDMGNITADRAALTAKVTGTLPTAVVDALANQKGLLVDLLGKTTTIALDANGLSKNAGSISANLNTDNAKANVAGSIASATFSSSGPATINLHRITPELSARYLESVIPIISRVEKTDKDEPAVINAQQLTLPTDGDTRKINGLVQVDLGTVQFETSDFFGRLVKIVGGKQSGQVGKRIKPFNFVAEQGVVTYEKIELPLGEFTIETRGQVDLNTERMDVITFVPFSALAAELSGGLTNIPGIEGLTMIPIRTRGSFDNPKSEVQLDLIVKESLPGALEKVIPPELKDKLPKDIGEGIKDLFKKKK